MPKMKVRLDKILRDEAKNMLGRTPAQGWLKPEQVTLFMPRLGRLSDLGNPAHDGLEKLEFVVDRPWAPFLPHTHPVRPSPDILDRFLRLAAAPASQIHQFASRFGPLFIFCKIDQRKLSEKLVIVEDCAVWRHFAASMGSLLRIASCFHANRRPDPADWQSIGACPAYLVAKRDTRYDLLSSIPDTPEHGWIVMAHFVRKGSDRDRTMWAGLLNVLLELGRVRPWLVWEGSGSLALPKLVFSGRSLLSYLALQLCLRASKHDAFAVCGYCNREYAPMGRAPKAGQRNFCPDCRASGVPVRMAQRARRERLREQNLAAGV